MITLLSFLVTLAILIVVHEYGHYRVARACGVKVLRFSVGFGRVIWRRQKSANDTEFTLSMIPLGGYVRMLDERDGAVAPHEREQAFNNRPLRQRVAVVAAGPAANLLLAVLLFAAVGWIGMDEPRALLGTPLTGSVAERAGLRAGDEVRAVSDDGRQWRDVASLPELMSQAFEAIADGQKLHLDVTGSGHGHRTVLLDTSGFGAREFDAAMQRELGLTPLSEAVLGAISAGGAAEQAGLRSGDRVLSLDDRPVADGAGLRERIRAAVDGSPLRWRIERAGQTLDIEVQPKVVEEGGRKLGRIGAIVGTAPAMVNVRHGFLEGIQRGAQRTWDLSWLTLKTFGRMIIGEASLKNLGGPLAIADYAGQSARLGLTFFMIALASLSVSLGVFNLLPLPMLDGGHLMYYLFEGLSGRPVSEWWQRQLQRAGALILMLMVVLALSNDVVARLPGLH